MTDLNRNTRTLIVSFVVAIMALIPLRFVEVGQMSQAAVLGDMDVAEEVVLPNAQVGKQVVLEAPYEEIERGKVLGETTVTERTCLPKVEAESVTIDLKNQIEKGGWTSTQLDELLAQLVAVEKNVCR